VGYTIWLQNRKLKNAGSDDDDVARYQKVYDEIAFQLEERDEHDDGSFGPVLVRLSWHTSGTYDKETDTGGSNGATMRFAPEGGQSANAGLVYARDFLEPIKREASYQ
jgi:cytochrome c peroxidase